MKTILAYALALALAACLLVGGMYFSATLGRKGDIEALAKLGATTTWDAYHAKIPKEGADALPTYLQAQTKLRVFKDDWTMGPALTANKTDVGVNNIKVPQATRHLKRIGSVLSDLRSAAAMERCVFLPDPDVSRYDHGAVHSAVRTLCLSSYVENQNGEVEQALRDLNAVANVLRQLGKNPDFSSSLAYSSTNAQVLWHLREIVRHHPSDTKTLHKVITAVEELPPLRDLVEDPKSSYIYVLYFVSKAEKDPNLYLDGTPFVDSRTKKSISTIDRFKVHQLFSKGIQLDRKIFEKMPADHKDWQAIQRVYESFEAQASELATISGGDKPFLHEKITCGDWTQQLALRRMTWLSAKLMLWKSERGTLPTALPDFKEWSIDPFTGSRFGYVKNGDGFTLTCEPTGINAMQKVTIEFLPTHSGQQKSSKPKP